MNFEQLGLQIPIFGGIPDYLTWGEKGFVVFFSNMYSYESGYVFMSLAGNFRSLNFRQSVMGENNSNANVTCDT